MNKTVNTNVEINFKDNDNLEEININDLFNGFVNININVSEDETINFSELLNKDIDVVSEDNQKNTNIQNSYLIQNEIDLGTLIDNKTILQYNGISCIYLVCLGYIKEIRSIYNIDESYSDDLILCKYGLSKNLNRRLREHKYDFGKKLNKNIYLKFHAIIPITKLYFAENILEDIFIKLGLKFNDIPSKTELIAIPKENLDSIKYEYEKIKYNLSRIESIQI